MINGQQVTNFMVKYGQLMTIIKRNHCQPVATDPCKTILKGSENISTIKCYSFTHCWPSLTIVGRYHPWLRIPVLGIMNPCKPLLSIMNQYYWAWLMIIWCSISFLKYTYINHHIFQLTVSTISGSIDHMNQFINHYPLLMVNKPFIYH